MNWWKLISLIIIAVALFFLGFFTHKWTHETETVVETKYVQGEIIYDTIPIKVPIKEYIKPDTTDVIKEAILSGKYSKLFPSIVKYDTLLVTKEDTSRILHDWSSLREYENTLFNDDTLGSIKVFSEIQYNRLSRLSYEYSPIHKVISKELKVGHIYTPYIGTGIMTVPAVSAQVGLFIDNFGFAGQYQYDWNLKTHNGGIFILYKF